MTDHIPSTPRSTRITVRLHIWRQAQHAPDGAFVTYERSVDPSTGLLEVLDALNEDLVAASEEPVAFESDCREGICGTCGITVNGRPHGPLPRTTTCQLRMMAFNDGDELWLEPLRAGAFPVVRDLVVDRSSLDRVIEAGGFISAPTGAAADANLTRVPADDAKKAFDYATCIGCGACVAACPNGAAQLFAGAKLAHLHSLPQGQPERAQRTEAVAGVLDDLFGACSNHGECITVCPKGIPLDVIGAFNRDVLGNTLRNN